MCGIVGLLLQKKSFDPFAYQDKLSSSLSHRGPDHVGIHNFENGFIVNTRLSIIDLSHGNQPFYSSDRSIAVIQNGEIYNYIEVKKILNDAGVEFETDSDTEVILRAYEHYGHGFVSLLNGMFAIAIIDHRLNELILVRDRLGVKPLYYYQNEGVFSFSSEIKSFLSLPNFSNELNHSAIYHFFNFNYVPLPDTIFSHVRHIKPGSILRISLRGEVLGERVYWDISNTPERLITEEDVIDPLKDILEDAVKIRLRSDVPIGAFLSGGLDSSLVCSVMKNRFNYSPETFTIGFNEVEFDESIYAKQLAEFLHLQNHLKIMSSDDVNKWGKLIWFNDQPHGDISFIPTYLVADEAAKKYKVVFSGDGGDEAFGGYLKYLSLLDSQKVDANYFSNICLFNEFSSDLRSLLTDAFKSKISGISSFDFFNEEVIKFDKKDVINQGILFDVKHLLPGNNLVKPDRMGMANSLEIRSPLLDYRIFELMFNLPGNLKISKSLGTKHLLKKLALNYLPENLVYRKKQMFTVPVGEWFRTSLASYLKQNILSKSFLSLDIFSEKELLRMVDEHCSGKRNYTRELRAILSLKLWFDKFIFEGK